MVDLWVQSSPPATRRSSERVTLVIIVLAIFFPIPFIADAHAEESQWPVNYFTDLHDQSLLAFEAAEKLRKKVVGLAPLLQYSSSVDLTALDLKPSKYWFGIRLPKTVSKAPTSYQGLKPDDFIRCQGLWVIPLGAVIDIPLRRGSAITMSLALNVGGRQPFENVLPGVSFVYHF